MSELTDKQKLFCDEYLKDLNGKQAAIRAGYSENTAEQQASRLLSNVKLQEYLNSKRKKLEKKTEVTQEWIIKNLKKVYKRCMQITPITDSEGNPLGDYKFEHSGATKSLELLGKTLGMFVDTKKLTGKITLTHEEALDELQ
jgi:phage terminase small subunit